MCIRDSSTITQDVPEGALGIARGKQRNIEDWVKRQKREGKKSGSEEESGGTCDK